MVNKIVTMRQYSGGPSSQKLDILMHKMNPINNKMRQRQKNRCAKIKPSP